MLSEVSVTSSRKLEETVSAPLESSEICMLLGYVVCMKSVFDSWYVLSSGGDVDGSYDASWKSEVEFSISKFESCSSSLIESMSKLGKATVSAQKTVTTRTLQSIMLQ